jgi:hypothetical protein
MGRREGLGGNGKTNIDVERQKLKGKRQKSNIERPTSNIEGKGDWFSGAVIH